MSSMIMGVDEAGRGPLVGDIFMAGVVIKEENVVKLKLIGVKDSKKLSRLSREKLFGLILSLAEAVIVTRISPQEIDNENINILEIKALCRLVSKLCSIVKIDKIYVDAFTDNQRILNYLKTCINVCVNLREVIAEYSADSKYVVVGAASIIAKVLRDRHIDMLKIFYGDFGSGYPSDKRTIDWLKKYYGQYNQIPSIVRRSWKTVKSLIGINTTVDDDKNL